MAGREAEEKQEEKKRKRAITKMAEPLGSFFIHISNFSL